MNERKLQKLFEMTKGEAAPTPPPDFAQSVTRALRSEARPGPVSLFDQLGALFPRLAVAASLVIVLCLAADYWHPGFEQGDITSGVAQLSDEWLFATKGF